MTNTSENISAIGEFLSRELKDTVQKWELCTFNNLCNEKYRKLGMDWSLEYEKLLSDAVVDKLLAQAKKSGEHQFQIALSGLTRSGT